MALSKTVVKKFLGKDVSFENAYIKVSSIEGSKDSMMAKVDYFDAKDGNPIKQGAYAFDPDLSGDNFIKQAYEHLKTLSEFANAEDV